MILSICTCFGVIGESSCLLLFVQLGRLAGSRHDSEYLYMFWSDR